MVLLTGRDGIFSAGFDLKVFGAGTRADARDAAARRDARPSASSRPRCRCVTACNGHAYPMGAFLMLSADRRIGTAGNFRIGLNEVAIELTLPLFAVEIARQRLTPPYFQRVVTGDLYGPDEAVVAGFLDEVVAPGELAARSREVARALTAIDYTAHAATKLRLRGAALAALRQAIESELATRPAPGS